MRQQKWGYEDLEIIVKNYNPNRGDEKLSINGAVVEPVKRSLLTDDFDKEMFWYIETAIPSVNYYGAQFGIGVRTSAYKFLSYGADLGYASAKYIDDIKRIENHPGHWADAPFEEADLSKQSLFRFNVFAGAQLPFALEKVYLKPAAHITFGGMLGTEYAAYNYGPMATLDVGFRMKQGAILLIGGGYRRNIPLKSQEDKDKASAPGFAAYEAYGNLLFRISYKF
jgi:hypothetical protein